MGTRRPLHAGISVRREGTGPWTSAVGDPQSHEIIELHPNRHLGQIPGDGEGPGKSTFHSNPLKGHLGKEAGQKELLTEKKKNNDLKLWTDLMITIIFKRLLLNKRSCYL